AGVRADEPVARLADQDAALPANDLRALRQHDLDLARVLPRLRRHLARALARCDIREMHDAPLALRHDLLGDDDDVAVADLLALGMGGAPDERREIVARPDLRQTVDGGDRELRQRFARARLALAAISFPRSPRSRGVAAIERLSPVIVRLEIISGLRWNRPRWS